MRSCEVLSPAAANDCRSASVSRDGPTPSDACRVFLQRSYTARPSATGFDNTAIGVQALGTNSTGNSNTASGISALYSNTTGSSNTASGARALSQNTTGGTNTALGANALMRNDVGNSNTAIGESALINSVSGMDNIAIGKFAGANNTTGRGNIHIGNFGADESSNIRIGNTNHIRTFIAGIRGVTTTSEAVPVVINSVGQLGTISSSRRFKEDIRDMGELSARLLDLHPVVYRYTAET